MSEHKKISAVGRASALACAGALMFFLSVSSHAETVTIPLGQQGKAWNVETPTTGMRKDQVEEKFGTPIEKSGPVGTPPIYTWDYSQFTVYFESDHVIHSVAKAPPKSQ
jgi:outer membrane protein assembly factor BamE (lipoprotein component of BamABCDE complex)